MNFHKGDRVKLSAKAREEGIRPHRQTVLGTIATNRIQANKTYAVIWDGTNSSETLHESFICAAGIDSERTSEQNSERANTDK